jgi:hypothetical protein
MIKWPALLSFTGDPELEFIENQQAWDLCLADYAGHFVEGDQLIDSQGLSYQLTPCGSCVTDVEPRSRSLEQIIDLIQAHSFAENKVCVAKISAPNIPTAIALLRGA